jgi:hypothetical protein
MKRRGDARRHDAAGRALAGAVMAAALAGAACAGTLTVTRVFGERTVEGRYIEPEAYAAYLRGAIAEDSGDLRAALAAYEEASRVDPHGPEAWTRIADVRCKMSPRDSGADESFAHALAEDVEYAPAWEARARCELARGDVTAAQQSARRAAELDPMATEAQVLLARVDERGGGRGGIAEGVRARLVGLTLVERERVAAWDALATFAEAHGDVALWARALRELARLAPLRHAELARTAEMLAGAGELAQARALAGAIADAGAPALLADARPLAARLAVDDAVARGDAERARRRASVTHVGLVEAAARALLAGDASMAEGLAAPVAVADPRATGARLVVAASRGGTRAVEEIARALVDVRPGDPPVPASVVVAIARTATPEDARGIVAAVAHDPFVPGDALVTPLAVELAARGALAEDVLPADGAVELAARRAQPVSEGLLGRAGALDARHEYLALALTHPESTRAQVLGSRLSLARATDSIVAVAWARCLLATGAAFGDGDAQWLLARDPGDPLVAAAALDVARRVGNREVASKARATLTAVARTAAEKRAVE